MHAASISICRASCPRAVSAADLPDKLEETLAASGWDAFSRERHAAKGKHPRFRIAAALCANGCSQPHIADFGLIATARITVRPEKCAACGQCLVACAEDAVSLDQGLRLDPARCLGCLACVRVCPEAALSMKVLGYRVLLGGRLGRHPRLAHELGFFSEQETLRILSATLALFEAHHRPRLRLGDLIRSLGRERFDRLVRP